MGKKYLVEIEMCEGYGASDLSQYLNRGEGIHEFNFKPGDTDWFTIAKKVAGYKSKCMTSQELLNEPWFDEENACSDDISEEKASSVIKQIEYNWPLKEMRVTFQSGKVYTYVEVGINLYEEFVIADSKGSYFNEYVKGNYDFRKE
jgi:hypothetical protein